MQLLAILLIGLSALRPPTPLTCTAHDSSAVNGRAGPSLDRPVIGMLRPGQSVPGYGYDTTGHWAQVDVDGLKVWVSLYVVTCAEITPTPSPSATPTPLVTATPAPSVTPTPTVTPLAPPPAPQSGNAVLIGGVLLAGLGLSGLGGYVWWRRRQATKTELPTW